MTNSKFPCQRIVGRHIIVAMVSHHPVCHSVSIRIGMCLHKSVHSAAIHCFGSWFKTVRWSRRKNSVSVGQTESLNRSSIAYIEFSPLEAIHIGTVHPPFLVWQAQITQHVVERAVFHCKHNDVIDVCQCAWVEWTPRPICFARHRELKVVLWPDIIQGQHFIIYTHPGEPAWIWIGTGSGTGTVQHSAHERLARQYIQSISYTQKSILCVSCNLISDETF